MVKVGIIENVMRYQFLIMSVFLCLCACIHGSLSDGLLCRRSPATKRDLEGSPIPDARAMRPPAMLHPTKAQPETLIRKATSSSSGGGGSTITEEAGGTAGYSPSPLATVNKQASTPPPPPSSSSPEVRDSSHISDPGSALQRCFFFPCPIGKYEWTRALSLCLSSFRSPSVRV